MQFPRCRATVSENIAPGHWIFREGLRQSRMRDGMDGRGRPFLHDLSFLLASQETGANFIHKPLSRVKEE